MSERKAIPKRTRFNVFMRDGFQCQYCGRTPPDVVLHLDHFVPIVAGGTDAEENLLTSCLECNLGKGTTELRPQAIDPAKHAAALKEAEDQLAAYRELLQAKQARIDQDVSAVHARFGEMSEGQLGLTGEELNSIRQFLREWPRETVIEALEIAVNRLGVKSTRLIPYMVGIFRNWRDDRAGRS